MRFWQQVLRAWGVFFLGSPRRTFLIIGVGYVLYLLLNPSAWEAFSSQILAPLFQLAIVVGIIWWVLRKMYRSAFPAKKKGGK